MTRIGSERREAQRSARVEVAEEELELASRKLEGSAVEREFTHEETINGIRAMLGKGNGRMSWDGAQFPGGFSVEPPNGKPRSPRKQFDKMLRSEFLPYQIKWLDDTAPL
jgi:hypothetical protein